MRWQTSVLVGHRVEEHVDRDAVPVDGELVEVLRVFSFALPRIAHVGVVRHEDHHASMAIGNRARVDLGAVRATL